MERLQEHYDYAEHRGNGEIFAIFLQGSQNYVDDMFFESSDVDSRAIYIPSVRDLCLGKDISQPEIIMENTEHIDRFDTRKFIQLLKKPGINNYENIFTEYYIINPKYQEFYDRIVEHREDIVRADETRFLLSTMGISRRDVIDLQKRSGGEDYDIETFGYSRKRLSNIIRFNATAKAYIAGKPFSQVLKSVSQQEIHDVRRTEKYTLEEALEMAKRLDAETYELAKSFEKGERKIIDYTEVLEDIFVDLVAEGIREELKNTQK